MKSALRHFSAIRVSRRLFATGCSAVAATLTAMSFAAADEAPTIVCEMIATPEVSASNGTDSDLMAETCHNGQFEFGRMQLAFESARRLPSGGIEFDKISGFVGSRYFSADAGTLSKQWLKMQGFRANGGADLGEVHLDSHGGLFGSAGQPMELQTQRARAGFGVAWLHATAGNEPTKVQSGAGARFLFPLDSHAVGLGAEAGNIFAFGHLALQRKYETPTILRAGIVDQSPSWSAQGQDSVGRGAFRLEWDLDVADDHARRLFRPRQSHGFERAMVGASARGNNFVIAANYLAERRFSLDRSSAAVNRLEGGSHLAALSSSTRTRAWRHELNVKLSLLGRLGPVRQDATGILLYAWRGTSFESGAATRLLYELPVTSRFVHFSAAVLGQFQAEYASLQQSPRGASLDETPADADFGGAGAANQDVSSGGVVGGGDARLTFIPCRPLPTSAFARGLWRCDRKLFLRRNDGNGLYLGAVSTAVER